jgi:glycosyltransferase 2 family protein
MCSRPLSASGRDFRPSRPDMSALLIRVTQHDVISRLATRMEELASARRLRRISQIFLAAALVFVLLRLRNTWQDSHGALTPASIPYLFGSAFLAVIAVVVAGLAWVAILRELGVESRRSWAAMFMQAQLGKYIPGSVWQYAGRAALARVAGVPVRLVAASVTIELVAATAAGIVAVALVGGPWAAVAAIAVLAAVVAALRRRRIVLRPTVRAVRTGVEFYALVWVLLGLSFWLAARALFPVSPTDIAYYTGTFALASLAGLFAFFAPVGLGVREAVLVALLRSRLGTADAILLAATSRGILTVVDLGTAAVGAWLVRLHSRRATTASVAAVREGDEADASV